MQNEKLTDMQRDALKELGNIGAGSAATALSQLLGKDIKLNVPDVTIIPIEKVNEKIAKHQQIIAAVYLRIYGEIQARALLILPQDKIFYIIDLLMKKKLGTTREFGENEQSAIKEIGNIIISSYLNALAKFIGLNSVPSVPALAVDMADAIIQTISAELAEVGPDAFLIENEMVEKEIDLSTTLLILPEMTSMKKILKALNDTIKGS
ncbi:MAG: chemotaxis protein CheC [Candidatus Goldbacteria bacterium]|nr:chemotaxis protein CheC [Candidatus Goldiibacteriota bacterium]